MEKKNELEECVITFWRTGEGLNVSLFSVSKYEICQSIYYIISELKEKNFQEPRKVSSNFC